VWAERAATFSAKSRDISQILVASVGLQDMQPRQGERVTYQRSCHMTNVQKVNQEPLKLLKSIPGIHFIEMNQADMCCGSAGIYNIVNYDAPDAEHALNERVPRVLFRVSSVLGSLDWL